MNMNGNGTEKTENASLRFKTLFDWCLHRACCGKIYIWYILVIFEEFGTNLLCIPNNVNQTAVCLF